MTALVIYFPSPPFPCLESFQSQRAVKLPQNRKSFFFSQHKLPNAQKIPPKSLKSFPFTSRWEVHLSGKQDVHLSNYFTFVSLDGKCPCCAASSTGREFLTVNSHFLR